ncbi:MAG: transposase [Desulfovibrio sp.]|nr:transposase [Desulfovibrio sp.]
MERARKSGIWPLIKIGNTIAAYTFDILNWYDHPLSSGRLEGANNKIKALKRMAYATEISNFSSSEYWPFTRQGTNG